jgi:phosphoribosylformimino-5-aminoimidazole carboxamide ribotide isomerase
MEVIPVIDLKVGVVVHARQGDRDAYRPIETPLSESSAPADVVAGLLKLYPFRRLYIADLDAIMGGIPHTATLLALAAQFPQLELWVDNGIANDDAVTTWLCQGLGHLVIGSESQTDTKLLQTLRTRPRAILSLDFRGEAFQGPSEILHNTELWPNRLIVMTLARVGSNSGPDLTQLKSILARAGGRRIYAAGGVRNRADLLALTEAGAAGALVATALHTGKISAADLQYPIADKRDC